MLAVHPAPERGTGGPSAARVEGVLPDGTGVLIEAGGDIAAVGIGIDAGCWPIAIEDPDPCRPDDGGLGGG